MYTHIYVWENILSINSNIFENWENFGMLDSGLEMANGRAVPRPIKRSSCALMLLPCHAHYLFRAVFIVYYLFRALSIHVVL